MEEKTVIKSNISFVNAETLQTEITLSLGQVRNVSQVERMRKQFQENNPEYLVLADFQEVINPNYSPLNP